VGRADGAVERLRRADVTVASGVVPRAMGVRYNGGGLDCDRGWVSGENGS
jgi:hypothetical protein